MNKLPLSKKKEIVAINNLDYQKHEEFPYKICAEPLLKSIPQDCYREKLVSLYQMAPLVKYTVPIEEADYILYSNPTASIQYYSEAILKELESIDKKRKPNAEIIICGKATNIKSLIENKYKNITYVDSRYTEYVGKRFGINMKDEYVVYDDSELTLNIWPVDGCKNKCGFCRRTYMHIPFESQALDYLKEKLDNLKENHPYQLRVVSLRAENLSQYGLDLYGKRMLHEVINLLDSYEEVEYIQFPFGLNIGEINEEILTAICNCKKIIHITLYLEAGSDRLLKLINKTHNCEQAKQIIKTIRTNLPNVSLSTAVIIGLPTEQLEDIISLADLIMECEINHVMCNYYGYVDKHPIAKYKQLSDKEKQYHLEYLIKYLKEYYYDEKYYLHLSHETFYDPSKRSHIKRKEQLKKIQANHYSRVWFGVTNAYFVGNNIVVKSYDEELFPDELMQKTIEVEKQRLITTTKPHVRKRRR